MQKEISISLVEDSILSGEPLHGTVFINYTGRFDSLVINSQIENSSDIFSYTSLNGKSIKHPYARISIFKTELDDWRSIEFSARTDHVPSSGHSKAKFRASIIQEHKEVAADIAYTRIVID